MDGDQLALIEFFYASFSTDVGLLSGEEFRNSRIGSDPPLVIADLSGAPLFADYAIVGADGARLGTVRSSARGETMPLIDSIMIGAEPFDIDAAIAAAKVAATQSGGTVTNTSVVCYGYPRIGILVTCGAAPAARCLVYDAASGALVKSWQAASGIPTEAGLGASEQTQPPEGQPFYSVLEAIPESGEAFVPRLSSIGWADLRAAMAQTEDPGQPPVLGGPPSGLLPRSRFPEARMPRDKAQTSPALHFGISGTMLPLSLVGQQSEVYCAIATAQMMLTFLGVQKSQDEIAAVMQPGPFGTTNPNFVSGIGVLTGQTLTAQFKISPTFEDLKQVVEGMLPAKSGIPSHARALRGWRQYSFFDDQGTALSQQQFVVINDPYPVGSGRLTLENIVKPIPEFYTNVVSMARQSMARQS